MTEAEAKSVVIEARVRHGIPRFLADTVDTSGGSSSTLHGRMRLRGRMDERDPDGLSAAQYDAAEWFLGRRMAWLRYIKAPGAYYERPDREPTGEEPTFEEAKAAWTVILDCLQEVSVATRSPVLAAFDTLLVRQVMVPHLIGDLRLGLNAIHRSFLQGRNRRAA